MQRYGNCQAHKSFGTDQDEDVQPTGPGIQPTLKT